ncbi:MAG: IPT/TIG domain-containing protein [Planctomycetes bacterium]|nr:IPT/TIG domain-containing protein [Planctomycetota bacterium]
MWKQTNSAEVIIAKGIVAVLFLITGTAGQDVTITSVDPPLIESGTSRVVTFIGEGFDIRPLQMRIGDTPLTDQVLEGPTRITGTAPALAPGFYDVSLWIFGAFPVKAAELAHAIEVAPRARVSKVVPDILPIAGGIPVEVHGENFRSVTEILFERTGGMIPASYPLEEPEFVSETLIRGIAPSVRIGIERPPFLFMAVARDSRGSTKLKDAVRYDTNPPPVAVSVDPFHVFTEGGTPVSVNGFYFQEDTVITFDAQPLIEPQYVSENLITGTAPAQDGGEKDVHAEDARGRTTLEKGVLYMLDVAPQATSVVPDQIPVAGGIPVEVHGYHFLSETVISFEGAALRDQTFVSHALITGTAPPMGAGEEPGPRDVVAADWRGTTKLKRGITYFVPVLPEVLSVDPNVVSTEGGTPVDIHGRDFRADTVISFGTHALRDQVFVSDALITGTAPPLDSGEPEGPKTVYAEDARGRTWLVNGVTYRIPPAWLAPPKQIETALAEGRARFDWCNSDAYAAIFVMDASGSIIDQLPGDATRYEIDAGIADAIELQLQAVAEGDRLSDIVGAYAVRLQCDHPAPLTGLVYVGKLEFSLYGGSPMGKAEGVDALGVCGPSANYPQQPGSVGFTVPQRDFGLALPRHQMTTGFILENPADKLEIAGFYKKVNVKFGLELRGRLRRVFPADGGFTDEFVFPDIRTDEDKDWHRTIYSPTGGGQIPPGEYLLDIIVSGGDPYLPYYVFADDARDNELLIPGAPCPPYPMVTVTDMTGLRTLPVIDEVQASEAHVDSAIIHVKLSAIGEWRDEANQPHSIVPGGPGYVPTPFFKYTWIIHKRENPTEETSESSSSLWTTVPVWSCYSVELRIEDRTCGTSVLYTPPPFPVIPANLPTACDNAFATYLFPVPDPQDILAVAGVNASPRPGNGTFSGMRPLWFRFLVIPCSCGNPANCPTPREEDLRFRLVAEDQPNPVLIYTDAYGTSPGLVVHVDKACQDVVKGPTYFTASITDLHRIPSILPEKKDAAGNPVPVKAIFQGRATGEPGTTWHEFAHLWLFNHPRCLDNAFWSGSYDERDDSYHFVAKPGGSSQRYIPINSSGEIDIPDMPVTIPSYDNDMNSGFVSRFMMQGGLWDPDTGQGSNSGQILSNELDAAPVMVTPSRKTTSGSGKAGLSDFMEYTWCERRRIFQNQFSQTLFEAILYTGTVGPVPVTVWASVGLSLGFNVDSQVEAFVKPFGAMEGGPLVGTNFYLLSSVEIQIPCEIRADVLFGIASIAARLIPEADFSLNTRVGTLDANPVFGLQALSTFSLAFEMEACVWALVDDICYSPGKIWLLDGVKLLEDIEGDYQDPTPCGKGSPEELVQDAESAPDPRRKTTGPGQIFTTTSAPATAVSPDGQTTIDAWIQDTGYALVYVNGDPDELPDGPPLGAYIDPAITFVSNEAALIAWTRDYSKEESGLTLPLPNATIEQRNTASACKEVVVTPVIWREVRPGQWAWTVGEPVRLSDVPGEVAPEEKGADGRAAIGADLTAGEAFIAWVRFDTPDFLVEEGTKSLLMPMGPSGDGRREKFKTTTVPYVRPNMRETAIYVRRADTADRLGDAVKISPPGINIEPSIAVSRDGEFTYCVWIHDYDVTHKDLIQSNIGRNIYYAFHQKGVGWSAPQPVLQQPEDYPGVLEPAICLLDGRNGVLAFTSLLKGSPERDTGLTGGARFVYACRLEDGVFGEPYLIHGRCQPRSYGHWVTISPGRDFFFYPIEGIKCRMPEVVMGWHSTGPMGSAAGSGDQVVAVLGQGMSQWSQPINLTPDDDIHSNIAFGIGGNRVRGINLNGGPAGAAKAARFAAEDRAFEIVETSLEPDPAIAELRVSEPFAAPGAYLTYTIEVENRGLANTPLDASDRSLLGVRLTFVEEDGSERVVGQVEVPEIAPGESVRLEVLGEMPIDPVLLRAELDPDPVDRDETDNVRELYLGAPAPREFTCELVVRNDGSDRTAARLSWENPILYDELHLYRDGAMFATLSGHSTSFVDLNVAAASHTYAIRGKIGASRSARATCRYSTANTPPVPVIAAPDLAWQCAAGDPACEIAICAGDSLDLYGGDSYDPGRGQFISNWEWDLDGDGVYDDDAGRWVSVEWLTPGTREIGLRVTDDFEGDPLSAIVRASVRVQACGFVRGDVNADGSIDLGDPIWNLNYQFAFGPVPPCLKAADTNDSGVIDLADAIYLLSHLFSEGKAPPPPYPTCGADPTPDGISCEMFAPCGR